MSDEAVNVSMYGILPKRTRQPMTLWVLIPILLLALALAWLMLNRDSCGFVNKTTVGIDAASINLFGQMPAVHRARGGGRGRDGRPAPSPARQTLGLA